MKKYFVLFREGRRLLAAQVELPSVEKSLVMNQRQFDPAGNLGHWNHLVDMKKRLIGFKIDSLDKANKTAKWQNWWSTFDNREMVDFSEAYLFWLNLCLLIGMTTAIFLLVCSSFPTRLEISF